MWKALVGFLVFAAIALFFIFKAGDKMDMQGEAGAHTGAASEHMASDPVATPASAASVPAPVVDAAASAASAPAMPAVETSPAAASASANK
ncbi:hypothetical protein [Undibacterium sp.]|uniref:hypothetical protein n=1 Tax=Undibacterium sp. TaxID=1914977 RepID=UPI00375252D2